MFKDLQLLNLGFNLIMIIGKFGLV